MIKVTMYIDDLLELLESRWRRWTDDELMIETYLEYYEDMLNSMGELAEFNPCLWVDNDYINDTEYITHEQFEDYGIEDVEDERVLWVGQEGHYIISTY